MALVKGTPQFLVETDANGGIGFESHDGRQVGLLSTDGTRQPQTIQLDPAYSGGIRAHARAAAVALKSTGGIIQFPAGEFDVWGLPIFPGITYRGVGYGPTYLEGTRYVTRLKLPASPTDHMFVAKWAADDATYGITENSIAGFSIENLECDGGQTVASMNATTGYDCVNFDALDTAAGARVERCFFSRVAASGFRCFYRNNCSLTNCRDRAPCFDDMQCHECWAGVWTNEHPIYSGVNIIRDCKYGITGQHLYDQVISNCRINYCANGIAPQPGYSIQRTSIVGNMLALCGVAIDLGGASYAVTISGNVFAPLPAGASACAIKVSGAGINRRIANNVFDADVGYAYTQGHITIDNSSATVGNFFIQNNSFRANGSKVLAALGSTDVGRWDFAGNDVVFETGAAALAFCDFSGCAVIYADICNNRFRIRHNVGNGIMAKLNGSDTFGVCIRGNHVYADATGYADTMWQANFNRGMICENLFRNVTNAVIVTAKDTNSLPAGIAVGTTSVSTDGAAIKSRNIVS